MDIRTALRRSAASALAGLSLAGFALGAPFAASASASTLVDPVPLLSLHNLTVSDVAVYDRDQLYRNLAAPPSPFAPPSWKNPGRIEANDAIAVCATVTATFWSTTATSALTFSGPDYSWSYTLPRLTKGSPYQVCTPFLPVNFSRAAAWGLISTGYQGVVHPGNECVPIVLKAATVDSSVGASGFWQNGIPQNCGYPTVPLFS